MEAVSPEDFRRLESKVDRLTDAVGKLILFEERQATQGVRIGDVEKSVALLESAHSRTEKKVDKWINMGMGAWALAVTLFALVQFGAKIFK